MKKLNRILAFFAGVYVFVVLPFLVLHQVHSQALEEGLYRQCLADESIGVEKVATSNTNLFYQSEYTACISTVSLALKNENMVPY